MSLKRRVADILSQALNAHIIPKGKAGWPEEHFSSTLLGNLAIDCVFDVGANIGQYGRELRRLGFKGTILSFEPGPAAFASLTEASRSDPNWHIFNYALGAEEASLPFNIMKSTAMSSFLQPSTREGEMFADVNVVEATIEVPVHTLSAKFDELKAQYRFSAPFLKLDTQGFDLQVIKGAGQTLSNFRGILSEVSVTGLYAGAPMVWDSLNAMSDAGFDLVGMYSVHPGNIRNPHEFNCYVLRRDLA